MFVKKTLWLSFCLIVLVATILSAAHTTKADPYSADWFASVTPTVAKAQDYPSNNRPLQSNLDCYEKVIGTQKRCAIDSNVGTVTTSGSIIQANKEYTLTGYGGFGGIIPVPNSAMFFDTRPGAVNGTYVALHRSLSRSEIVPRLYWGYPPRQQYETAKVPDVWLTDSNGVKLQINPQVLAFSSNGYWAVFDVYQVGVFKMNMATLDLFPVGPSIEGPLDFGLRNSAIAISDNGRFVATGSGDRLMLYDTSTCGHHGYEGGAINLQGCRYKDIWQGKDYGSGTTTDRGLKSTIDNGRVLGNLRFIDHYNIRFDALYGSATYADSKAAEYVVTAPGAVGHNLGLLGLGDSYISGEGEFEYKDGTDDLALNMCHLSNKSYPYLLGARYFGDSESVACSGAKTRDIYGDDGKYKGQFSTFSLVGMSKEQMLKKWMPGYIYQSTFVKASMPSALVLSIGGNDIGFGDILTSCVSPTAKTDNHTCFATYEDRKEKLQQINNAFDQLVVTYKTIKNASPTTRIYVVGYPQVVKPDGNCGLNVQLNKEETEFASQLIEYLNGVVELAAKNAGVYYVDTHDALNGHRLCEAPAGQAAMNGVTTGKAIAPAKNLQWLRVLGKESFHPTVLGHELLADSVARATHGFTAEMPAAQPNIMKPGLDPNTPLLTTAPKDNRMIYQLEQDDTMVDSVLLRGATTTISVNGLLHNTLLNGMFNAVLHSDPINIGSIRADANGDIFGSVTIPNSVPVGYHTLHLYGADMAGNNIDIQKVVYVASQDGPAFNGLCQIMADSDKDVDEDGIDDACDPVIGVSPLKTTNDSTGINDQGHLQPIGMSTDNAGGLGLSISAAAVMQPATLATNIITASTSFTDSISYEQSKFPANAEGNKSAEPQVLGAATHPNKDHLTSPHSANIDRWVTVIAVGAVPLFVLLTLLLRERKQR